MKKVAIFYLCHSGSTKAIAEKIQKYTQAVLFEVNPSKDYPNTQKSPIQIVEKASLLHPHSLEKNEIPNVKDFDVILFGYPNWWEGIPEPIKILVQELRLIDKQVAAFCTHEGARSHKKSTDIKPYFPYSTVLQGITLRNDQAIDEKLKEWLEQSILS